MAGGIKKWIIAKPFLCYNVKSDEGAFFPLFPEFVGTTVITQKIMAVKDQRLEIF